ncbi:MAG: iron ABC transporter permease [Rikenellaceae bacterium]|nr:iron ABC transporter permease [Rikenellaceae bacterium]MCL2693424.1 iron ABC transporter permease [Rikenellaceae bacterium]
MSRNRNILLFTLIALAVVVFFCLDILIGSESLALKDIWAAITGRGAGDEMATNIVRRWRIPKALTAGAAGAALAASGLQMQTLFRNPLAGPFVLGVSSGASLGVAVFLMGMPLLGVPLAGDAVRNLGIVGSAWVGGAAVLLIIMAVSARVKDIMAILILGIMFGSAATAVVEILQFLAPEGSVKSFAVWTMGSFGHVTTSQLAVLLPFVLAGLALSVFLIKPLNTLLLGENYARTMGQSVRRTRAVIFVSTILLAGSVTAFCGPIGFIGIAVPHLARMIFADADHRILMPASILLGAAVMLLCDMISQLPGYSIVLPVNTITALLGIPIVIIVIVRNRKIF